MNLIQQLALSLSISDRRYWSRPGMQGAESLFPLYLYSDEEDGIFNEMNENLT